MFVCIPAQNHRFSMSYFYLAEIKDGTTQTENGTAQSECPPSS